MIDYPQLARDIVANGGATVDIHTGETPTTGYAVSLAGYERRLRLPRSTSGLAHAVYVYVIDHGRQLRDQGAHLGAWIDGADVVLDVTHIYETRELAETLARLNRQDAIYNLATGEEINTRQEA